MVTLRVYDSASLRKEYETYVDRYCLYVPTPRNKVKEWGLMGMFLGFSFNDNQIVRCCWDECKYGVKTMKLGKKIKRDQLPKNVQEWINEKERLYNKALKENTLKVWEEWFRI